jgi:hypothetical protein
MDAQALPTPVLTGLDAVIQGLAALCYLAVGVAAWLRAPADVRTRVFLGLALANLVALSVPGIAWAVGVRDPAALPRYATAAMIAGIGVGALLLFHLSQVFPRRRPWIKTSGIQMGVAYLLTPIAIAALIRFAPAKVTDITPQYMLGFIVFGFPLLVLLGFVLPIAAVVSLMRSHRDAHHLGLPIARPIAWILISQVAGGVLALVFAPAIGGAMPGSPIVTLVTLAIWMLGLLTPFAFAAAVWRYELLSVDPG